MNNQKQTLQKDYIEDTGPYVEIVCNKSESVITETKLKCTCDV